MITDLQYETSTLDQRQSATGNNSNMSGSWVNHSPRSLQPPRGRD